MLRAVLMLAIAVLAGCQAQPRLATFNPVEYAKFDKPGTGAITGQAFLVTRGGEVKKAAGCKVVANPVTSYSKEWYDRIIVKGENIEPGDSRAEQYMRVTMADGEGRFKFSDLPEGDYYVASWITWELANGMVTGGSAYARAPVFNGKTAEVVVTKPRN